MNFKRILAVSYKDMMWAMFNYKLLSLILIPPIISAFIQSVTKGALVGFSLTFSFAMVGCFLTSYLITEEKRIESLKNILITPLTPSELSLGKLLLPLSISFILALLIFALAGQLRQFFYPAIFIGMMLMAGIVCLMGLFLGLFAKSEQELGITGPIFILLFMVGSINSKTSGLKFSGFFPEFHLVHLVDNYSVLTTSQIYLHLAYLTVEFLLILFLLTTYLKFFFSSDADSKRINGKSLLCFIPLFAFFVFSGLTAEQFRIANAATKGGSSHYVIAAGDATVDIYYDATKWELIQLKNKEIHGIELKSLENMFISLRMSLRELPDDEMTLEQRLEKIKKEEVVFLDIDLTSEEAPDFVRTISASKKTYATVYEKQCGKYVLRFRFDHPLIAQEYAKAHAALLDIMKTSKLNCPNP